MCHVGLDISKTEDPKRPLKSKCGPNRDTYYHR